MKSYGTRPFLAASALAAAAFFSASLPGAPQSDVKLDVPYVPTPQQVVDRMLELGDVSQEDYVIDLGSGDGRIPVTAASQYGAKAMGVDIDPRRLEEAEANAREAGVTDLVEFKRQDLFQTPIGDASVLTMYLLPSVNVKLRPRILEELQPGTRVVSHAFDMGEWEPDHQERVDGRTVYMWIVPARVEGRWEIEGEQDLSIELQQTFQQVDGSAEINGRTTPISDAELEGDRISFTVDGRRYVGRVKGDRIEGESPGGADAGWRGTRS